MKIEFGKKPGISVSPNPVTGNDLTIQLDNIRSENLEISLKRSDGALMFKRQIQGSRFDGTLHLDDFELGRNGLYILTVVADGQLYQEKLITLP